MGLIAVAARVVEGWDRVTTAGFAPAEREELRAWARSGRHELVAAGRARGRAPRAIAAALIWRLLVLGAPHDLGRWLRRVGVPGLRRLAAAGRAGVMVDRLRRGRPSLPWLDCLGTLLVAVAAYVLGAIILPYEPLTRLERALSPVLFWALWISAAHPWWRLLRATWRAAARRRASDGEAGGRTDKVRPPHRRDPAPTGAARATALRDRRLSATRRGAPRRRPAAERDPQAAGAPAPWAGRATAHIADASLIAALNARLAPRRRPSRRGSPVRCLSNPTDRRESSSNDRNVWSCREGERLPGTSVGFEIRPALPHRSGGGARAARRRA
jgi:hypothetical protein